jgi:hypothetical protein
MGTDTVLDYRQINFIENDPCALRNACRKTIVPRKLPVQTRSGACIKLLRVAARSRRQTNQGTLQLFAEVGQDFFMAALWDRWTAPDGAIIESATLITTEPNELVATIHDRMPAMLTPPQAKKWITSSYDQELLRSMLRPFPADLMKYEATPTSTSVGSSTGKPSKATLSFNF